VAPLDGILVADFSRVLAGPLASMLLGDLGADVVKVERPDGGDDTRAWGPPYRDGEATYYLGLNRNKRSLALDLGDAGDVELARRLAVRADVLIESFRPGLMARWGLDGDALRGGGNPRARDLLGDRVRHRRGRARDARLRLPCSRRWAG
jgi:crotonobetainyl-CoA:carnitine CoA-transferase CaiB-like acyl-CoA transferase